MKNFVLVLVTTLLLASCEKPQNNSNSNSCSDCCSTSIMNASNFDKASTDDFDISEAVINGDCLEIKVRVGGGCGDLFFNVLAKDEVMESSPTKREIRVVLDDQDFCKALLMETRSFDLSSLRTGTSGTDILILEGFNTALIYRY